MDPRRPRLPHRAARLAVALLWLGASLLLGCGRVHVGPDPEEPVMTSGDDRAEPPESGYADWPDDTLPLVTVDLERTPPRPPADEGDRDDQEARDPAPEDKP